MKTKHTPFFVVGIVISLLVVGGLIWKATHPLAIKSVEPLGKIENPGRPELIRDGGASGLVNGQVLWTFGDTLFNPKSVSGKNGYSSTAGVASLSDIGSVSEPLDANRAPAEFIPLTTADEQYNKASGKGDNRYAYWPTQVAPIDGGQNALVYYQRLKVNPGFLNYTLLNTGIARVAGVSTTATRVVEDLFPPLSPDARLFQHPGFSKDGYIYVMDCKNSGCALAKVTEAGALVASNYLFWNGSDWVADRATAAYSLPYASQVGWSEYLQKYVMVTGKPLGKDIYLRTSKSLTDGWSKEQKIFTASEYIYAVGYHGQLNQNGGKSLIISFYQPQEIPERGLQLLRVNL